jgi:hypothetical protein
VSLFPCHMCCWQYHPDLERLEIETGSPELLCASASYVVHTCLLEVWQLSLHYIHGPWCHLVPIVYCSLCTSGLNLNRFKIFIGLMVSNGTCKSHYCKWMLALLLFRQLQICHCFKPLYCKLATRKL